MASTEIDIEREAELAAEMPPEEAPATKRKLSILHYNT